MATEESIYQDIKNYINSNKHNRPCTLQSIKKEFRTQRIVDLIFSNPKIFKLEAEINHVPSGIRSNRLLSTFVLSNPKYFSLLKPEEQTIPSVLISFEFSRFRYETASAKIWGRDFEKIPYPTSVKDYKNYIFSICDNISSNITENTSIDELIDFIEEYCNSNEINLVKTEKYNQKYSNVNFNIKKPLFILVSGYPDSGKTTFANILSETIKNTVCLDSDLLLSRGLLYAQLSSLVKDKNKIVILSDIYADRFFSKEELGNSDIINILVNPISIETMHRNSKHMSFIPFDFYKKSEIDKINFKEINNSIIVTNDYTDNIYKEVDRSIEEIAKKLGLDLSQEQISSKSWKETLKHDASNFQTFTGPNSSEIIPDFDHEI